MAQHAIYISGTLSCLSLMLQKGKRKEWWVQFLLLNKKQKENQGREILPPPNSYVGHNKQTANSTTALGTVVIVVQWSVRTRSPCFGIYNTFTLLTSQKLIVGWYIFCISLYNEDTRWSAMLYSCFFLSHVSLDASAALLQRNAAWRSMACQSRCGVQLMEWQLLVCPNMSSMTTSNGIFLIKSHTRLMILSSLPMLQTSAANRKLLVADHKRSENADVTIYTRYQYAPVYIYLGFLPCHHGCYRRIYLNFYAVQCCTYSSCNNFFVVLMKIMRSCCFLNCFFLELSTVYLVVYLNKCVFILFSSVWRSIVAVAC